MQENISTSIKYKHHHQHIHRPTWCELGQLLIRNKAFDYIHIKCPSPYTLEALHEQWSRNCNTYRFFRIDQVGRWGDGDSS